VVTVVGVVLIATTLGALVESRSQHGQLAGIRQQVHKAAAEVGNPFAKGPSKIPLAAGTPVALLQIPRLGLERVVAEGVSAGRTQHGPGHVPGTAGVGQPGNAGVLGRARGYGAAFADLRKLRPGDQIVTTTRQGQSVYVVRTVRTARLARDPFATSADDRLTLVTGASWWPFDSSRAVTVTAVMKGKPFPPTAQAARSAHLDEGRHGEESALPLLVIWTVLLASGVVASVLLYRRWLPRSTYLLTTPALVALFVLATDAATRLLPAWW
jgi:sortase A